MPSSVVAVNYHCDIAVKTIPRQLQNENDGVESRLLPLKYNYSKQVEQLVQGLVQGPNSINLAVVGLERAAF